MQTFPARLPATTAACMAQQRGGQRLSFFGGASQLRTSSISIDQWACLSGRMLKGLQGSEVFETPRSSK